MIINVKPIGILKKYFDEQQIDVKVGITSNLLLKEFKIPEELWIVAFVNGNKMDLNDKLNDGDEIKLVTPLSGG